METKQKHFVDILSNYSFDNCKKCYYLIRAGYSYKEIGKMVGILSRYGYKKEQVVEMIWGYGETLNFEAEQKVRWETSLKTPYDDRTLHSWENEVITRAYKGSSGWYACLDARGIKTGWPQDFAQGAENKKDAIRFCAIRIRLAARGENTSRPHPDLNGYTLHYQLAEYWRKKETRRKYRANKKLL